MATRVADVDLASGPCDLTGLAPYAKAMVLVRWRGTPLGRLWLPVQDGQIAASDLWWSASASFGSALVGLIVEEVISDGSAPAPRGGARLTCSVVVCTRDRTEDLRRALEALRPSMEAGIEVIVVDNAPADDQSEQLARSYPVRYLRQPRSGVNWARSLGAQAAHGEIVAYTDDDAAVTPGWLEAILEPFRDPDVGAVTGLVIPYELETASQELFETHQSFIRGFVRRDFTSATLPPAAAARAGAGANMAIRRRLINDVRPFDEELDGGTATLTGGDTYALYHVLRLGYRIVYHPKAVVWHRHRLNEERLRRVVYGYSVGTYALLLHCLLRHRDFQTIPVGWDWFVHHHCRQLWWGLRRRSTAQPLWLTLSEVAGCFVAPWAYVKSRWKDWTTPRPPRDSEAIAGGAV